MKTAIKTFFKRYFILSKRLLKKPGFVAILLLVPILVAAMTIMAKNGDSGIVTVALVAEDKKDATANEIIAKLTADKSLIRFKTCKSDDEAVAMVEDGSADAAWIFKADFDNQIRDFINLMHTRNAPVKIVQREESVSLRLSHEKLNTVLYPYLTRAIYNHSLTSSSEVDASKLSKEEIDAFYDEIDAEGEDLFEFVYSNAVGNPSEPEDKDSSSLILSPLKGLLAIMILLSGIAVSMFYMQDEARGVFDRFPRGTGFSFSLIYHAAAVVMVGIAAFIALAVTGIAPNWYELPILLLYCACTVGFCMCLRMIIGDIRLFGTLAPLLIVVTAVLCPIFIAAPGVPAVQIFLPTFHYMISFTNKFFILYMGIYTAVLYLLAFALHSLRLKQRK